MERNLALVQRLESAAARLGCTPAQLALAWVLARGNDVIPIPGTKRVRYVEENAAAASVALTPADVAELDAAFPPDGAAGDRYNETMERLVDRSR
jgi:aryl-alcohol dehydrogenase-like predicted oxidoreductase